MNEKAQVFLNIGNGNIVQISKITSICDPESAPIKRMVLEAKNNNICIDATMGKKTQSVIFLNNNTLVLSPVQPKTLASRVDDNNKNTKD